jgi:hypothetical protein
VSGPVNRRRTEGTHHVVGPGAFDFIDTLGRAPRRTPQTPATSLGAAALRLRFERQQFDLQPHRELSSQATRGRHPA